MNYRHSYHAGNFADVLKHIVLVLCLDYLQRKEGGLCILDTHGGAGLYDLASEEAQKTGEWTRGVGCLNVTPIQKVPVDLALYLDLIRPDLQRNLYPGSPLIIARMLRPQDRLIVAELHEPTFLALETAINPYKSARAFFMDAYECARANLPPKERRGLVLIDPPFEQKDEFEKLASQMRQWKKRWATGTFLVWYPIKAHLPVAALHEAARSLELRRTWFAEALVAPRHQTNMLTGCGVIVFNAPFTVPERTEALLPYLRETLCLHETTSGWLVPNE